MSRKDDAGYIGLLQDSAESVGFRLVKIGTNDNDVEARSEDKDPYERPLRRLEAKLSAAKEAKETNRQAGGLRGEDLDEIERLETKLNDLRNRQRNEKLAESKFIEECMAKAPFGTRADFRKLFKQRRIEIALSERDRQLGAAAKSFQW